jgi:hypothetical protein
MEALLIIKIHVLHIEISVSIRALPISCAHNRPVLRKILVPAQIRALGNGEGKRTSILQSPGGALGRDSARHKPERFHLA